MIMAGDVEGLRLRVIDGVDDGGYVGKSVICPTTVGNLEGTLLGAEDGTSVGVVLGESKIYLNSTKMT